VETNNFKSVLENPQIALEKFENEIQLGRIAGPFQYSPISNLRCSPIGVIPKKTSGWRLINTFVLPDFWLLPIYPGDFDLLGFKIGSNYYIDKCLPMGCSISGSTFEHFSTFIHWLVSQEHGSQNFDNLFR
jgi:hypothetical protein